MPDNRPLGNIYDRIFRENAKHIFVAFIQQYFKLSVQSLQVLDPKFPSTSENEVDCLYEIVLQDGRKQIIHIEFQSSNDANMLARMQEYHAKIYKKYRLPVQPIVVNLSAKPFKAATKLEPTEVFYGYETIELFSLSTDELLSSQMPEVVILAILSNYPKEQLEGVLQAIVLKLKELPIAEKDRNRYANQLLYLSRLRKFEKETKEKLEEMLIDIDIKQDYYYKEGREEGREEGIEIGEEKGARVMSLHYKGNSPGSIAKELSIDIEEVKAIIEKYS